MAHFLKEKKIRYYVKSKTVLYLGTSRKVFQASSYRYLQYTILKVNGLILYQCKMKRYFMYF